MSWINNNKLLLFNQEKLNIKQLNRVQTDKEYKLIKEFASIYASGNNDSNIKYCAILQSFLQNLDCGDFEDITTLKTLYSEIYFVWNMIHVLYFTDDKEINVLFNVLKLISCSYMGSAQYICDNMHNNAVLLDNEMWESILILAYQGQLDIISVFFAQINKDSSILIEKHYMDGLIHDYEFKTCCDVWRNEGLQILSDLTRYQKASPNNADLNNNHIKLLICVFKIITGNEACFNPSTFTISMPESVNSVLNNESSNKEKGTKKSDNLTLPTFSIFLAQIVYQMSSQLNDLKTNLPFYVKKFQALWYPDLMDENQNDDLEAIIFQTFSMDPVSLVVKICNSYDNWIFPVHLCDQFYKSPLFKDLFLDAIKHLRSENKTVNEQFDLKEFIVCEYISSMSDNYSLHEIWSIYLDTCPVLGQHYLNIFYSRIPILDPEYGHLAIRIYQACQQRGLIYADTLCKIMVNQFLRQNQYDMALAWAFRSKLSKLLVEEICFKLLNDNTLTDTCIQDYAFSFRKVSLETLGPYAKILIKLSDIMEILNTKNFQSFEQIGSLFSLNNNSSNFLIYLLRFLGEQFQLNAVSDSFNNKTMLYEIMRWIEKSFHRHPVTFVQPDVKTMIKDLSRAIITKL